MSGLRVQVHLGKHDDFWSADDRMTWQAEAERVGITADMFVYAGAGHFFTDPSLADYQVSAARQGVGTGAAVP